jgi:transposase
MALRVKLLRGLARPQTLRPPHGSAGDPSIPPTVFHAAGRRNAAWGTIGECRPGSHTKDAVLWHGDRRGVGVGGLAEACKVTHVAMEATGVYGKPIYNLLEQDLFEAV